MSILDDIANTDMRAPVGKSAPAPTGNKVLDSIQNTDMRASVQPGAAGDAGNAANPTAPQPGDEGFLHNLVSALGQFGSGFNHRAAAIAGSIPDAVDWAVRNIPDPMAWTGTSPQQFAQEPANNPLLAPPGAWGQRAQGLVDATPGGAVQPQGVVQDFARGAGSGLADAGSVFVPATGLAGAAARLGPVASGVTDALAASPGLQAASGIMGGGVGQATGSPLLGAAASMFPILPSVAGAAVRGMTRLGSAPLTPEMQRLVGVAKQEGIPLSPAQELNSRPLQGLESVFRTLPLTAGSAAAEQAAQQQAFNGAVLRRAGQNAQFATPEVLQAAKEDIGGRLQDLASRNSMRVTPELKQQVQTVADNAVKYLPNDVAKPVLSRVKDFTDIIAQNNKAPTIPASGRMTAAQYQAMINGKPLTPTVTIPGQAYANLDSALGKQIRGTMDGNARQALGELRDALRGGMDASISGADAGEWQQARREYANLMTIANAMNRPSAASAAGNISPAALAQAANNRAMKSNAFGYGDLRDLGAVGQALVKEQVPNSGTPERTALIAMLTGGAGSVGSAAMYGGLPAALKTGAAVAASAAAPKAAQLAYNSGIARRALTNPNGKLPGLLMALGGRGLLSGMTQQQPGPVAPGPRVGLLDPASQMIMNLTPQ